MTGNDNFPAVLYLHGAMDGSDDATGNLIKNNYIHDNIVSTQYGQGSGNSPLVMTYYEKDTIYENNEIYNGIGPGIYHKSAPENTTVRYCFIHDNNLDGVMTSEGNMSYGGTQTIYQSIFANNNRGVATKSSAGDGILVYNCVFYNNEKGLGYWSARSNHHFFNNIFYITSTKYAIAYDENWSLNTFDYLDYNVYYASSGNNTWYINYGTVATSLSGWETWLTKQGEGAHQKEENSSTSNPNFLNVSGSFNTPTDFKRSSYPTDGRGGSWPSVRGAYITGNEIIGPSADLPPPDMTPPDPPQNPRIP